MTVPFYELQVTWPVAGAKPKNSKVYIGTENTFSDERLAKALEEAIAKREKNMKKYQAESNMLKRIKAEQAGVVRGK